MSVGRIYGDNKEGPGILNSYRHVGKVVMEEYYGTTKVRGGGEEYLTVLNRYMACAGGYLIDVNRPKQLEKELKRRDLDLICADELYNMKRQFLETDCLDYDKFT